MANDLWPVNGPVQGVSAGFFPKHIVKQLFRQYVAEFPFSIFTGIDPRNPIVVHKMKPGEGLAYTVGQLNSIDYRKPVINFNQVSGNGQRAIIDEFTVATKKLSFLYEVIGKDILRQGTPIDIPANVRPLLIEACQRNLNMCILESAMYKQDITTPNNGGYLPATQKPSYDRIVLAGIAPGGATLAVGPSAADRAAYYGKAGLTTVFNAMTGGIDYTTNGLSAKHLMRLKSVASAGGYRVGATLVKGTIENKITPAYMKTYKGAPAHQYLYFCSPESYAQLTEDPAYYRVTTARGAVTSPNQPEMISGAAYRGEFNGVHIYEVEQLADYVLTSLDGNKRVAWELFVGAGAWSLGWADMPEISFKPDVTNSIDEYTTHEIRGQEAIKFKAKQADTIAAGILQVEQGIIHSFVRV